MQISRWKVHRFPDDCNAFNVGHGEVNYKDESFFRLEAFSYEQYDFRGFFTMWHECSDTSQFTRTFPPVNFTC